METKTYPQNEYQQISTSTIVVCHKCRKESLPYEPMYEQGNGDKYFHPNCAPRDKPSVIGVTVKDDVKIKSEGR